MKKILFLYLFLTGCYSPLYMNNTYPPTNPEDVIIKGTFESKNNSNTIEDICDNAIQIAYNKVESTPFIFFSNEQYLIDKIRQDAASMGGDVAVVYNIPSSIFFIFSTTHAYYIVYKCNVNNRSHRSTYNTTQTPKQQTQKTTKQNIQYIPSSYVY